jgi:phosphotransferase system HPr-like phosphotransfer protein
MVRLRQNGVHARNAKKLVTSAARYSHNTLKVFDEMVNEMCRL